MAPHAFFSPFFLTVPPSLAISVALCKGRLINLPLSMCKINEMICHTTHTSRKLSQGTNPIRNVLINSRGSTREREEEGGKDGKIERKNWAFFVGQSSVEKTLKYIDFVALLSAFGMPNKHARQKAARSCQAAPSSSFLPSPLSLFPWLL